MIGGYGAHRAPRTPSLGYVVLTGLGCLLAAMLFFVDSVVGALA